MVSCIISCAHYWYHLGKNTTMIPRYQTDFGLYFNYTAMDSRCPQGKPPPLLLGGGFYGWMLNFLFSDWKIDGVVFRP